jgi:biotin synthase-related radical SAM superfamily protein
MNTFELDQLIETTEAFQTNILITEAFFNESCSWCEKPLKDICGRYAFKDDDEKPANLVTLCIHCLNGERSE